MRKLIILMLLLSCGDPTEVKNVSQEQTLRSWVGDCLINAEKAFWETDKEKIFKIMQYDNRTNKYQLLFEDKLFTFSIIELYTLKKEVFICEIKECWLAKNIKCEGEN